jgi:cysteine desulfurase/selenocysteine lyase
MKPGLKKNEIEKIKEDFPILKRKINGNPLVYLDSAATSQKPRQVIEAMNSFYSTYNANIHRGLHRLSEEATLAYEEAHRKAGKFINARFEEIVFTKNTTESINLLAYSLTRTLKKGDEIVLSQMEHHSNLVPWQQLAKERGLVLKFLEIDENGRLKDGFSPIGRKTRIVSVTHMSNVLGTINPVKDIAATARDNGALMIVDAAQSVPHFPVDVRKLGCDFLVFSGHKMLGPTGIGVLYGRKDILEEMEPFLYGGDMIKEVTFEKTSFNDLPWKFEAGTSPIAEGIGLAAAIDYLERLGMERIFRHEKALTEYAFERLDATLYGPPPEGRGGVISFNAGKIHPHDLATLLDQDGIAIRGGHHCAQPLMGLLGVTGTARASFYLYNTGEDVERLAEAISKARKVFS